MQLGRCAVGGSKVITMNNAGSLDGDHDGGRLYLPSIVYIVHVLRDAGLAASIAFGLLNARHPRDRVDIRRPYLSHRRNDRSLCFAGGAFIRIVHVLDIQMRCQPLAHMPRRVRI